MCGQPIPVNAPEESVHCDHCQNDLPLPVAMWVGILRDFDESHEKISAEKAASTTRDFDGMIAHFAYRRSTPHCEKCNAPYGIERIDDGATQDIFCTSCGDPGSTMPPVPRLKHAIHTLAQIFLTDPRGAALHKQQLEVGQGASPVIMQCPGCGAPLRVTAASPRTVHCDHCSADVYLPDDLWRRLHPAKTVREWYARFTGETDGEREEKKRREHEAAAAAHRARNKAAEDARRDERHRADLADRAQRDAAARAHAEAAERARNEAVARAKRNAYFALTPLYGLVATVVAIFPLADALELDLPTPVIAVFGGLQLVAAIIAAILVAKPIQKRLDADSSHMMAYHFIWVIFSFFVFPFGPIVFIVGLKRFFGTFGAATLKDGSGYHAIKAAKLAGRESWPAALFFLAMSAGVAGEIAAGSVHFAPTTTTAPGRGKR
jgi:hypothetical protein